MWLRGCVHASQGHTFGTSTEQRDRERPRQTGSATHHRTPAERVRQWSGPFLDNITVIRKPVSDTDVMRAKADRPGNVAGKSERQSQASL